MKLCTSVLPLTRLLEHSIIHGVLAASTVHRGTISGLIIAALTTGLVLPPAHIHLATDEHDHHHAAVEHAHWAAHHQSPRAFDDDDGRVLFIDHPAVVRIAQAHLVPPPIAVVALPALAIPLVFSGLASRTGGNAVRDGPAVPAFHLRGPPVVL
jgi:hypothetical protein